MVGHLGLSRTDRQTDGQIEVFLELLGHKQTKITNWTATHLHRIRLNTAVYSQFLVLILGQDHPYSVSKVYTGLIYKLPLTCGLISDVCRSFIRNKTTFTKYCLTQWISKHVLWNPLSKAVPGKSKRSGRHSKHNCLQDQANFHRSWARQIVLIFNTAYWCNPPLVQSET